MNRVSVNRHLRELRTLRPRAWWNVMRLGIAYAAASTHRRRVRREIDDFTRGPGRVIREALAREGDGPVVLFACFHDFRAQIKYELAFAAALAARGARVRVLTLPSCSLVRRYWTAMGRGDAVHTLRDADESRPRQDLPGEGSLDVQRLLSMTYQDVSVGRWALATTFSRLRKSCSELHEPRALAMVAESLAESYHATDAANDALDRIKPRTMVFLEKGYSPAGQLYETALARGVDTVQYVHGHGADLLLLKRFRPANRFTHPAEPSAATWSTVLAEPPDAARTETVRRSIREAYAKGEWFNRKYGQAGKRFVTVEELKRSLRLDAGRRTAVIFTHVGWDATFFYGVNLFADYDEWLVETVRAAADIRDVNWIVRVHPDNLWKAKAGGRSEDLDRDRRLVEHALGRIPDNVRWLGPDSAVRTDSLFDLTDVCVTVRGTIGLEMACMGKQVVTGGTGRYSGYGFTIDPPTRADYLATLGRLGSIPAPTSESTDLAARYVDTLIRLRPLRMQSTVDRQVPADQVGKDALGSDLEYRFFSLQELRAAPDFNRLVTWILDSPDEDLMVPASAG
jgi:hypothetical protein